MKLTANRYHDFSYGHRVYGHESKCSKIHGHNGRVTFHCEAPSQDALGRVIDFSVIKITLCQWIEDNWDHCFLVWENDPLKDKLLAVDTDDSIVVVPFNPTAENMALFLLNVVGPSVLEETGVKLVKVIMEETRKCGVVVES